MCEVVLIRGTAGGGKSTLAKTFNCLHLEPDMAMTTNGKYIWTPERCKAAHEWTYNAFCEAVKVGMDVVVSSVFTKKRDIQRYLDFCKEQGVSYRIIKCVAEFQNTHNVPPHILESMKKNQEAIEGEEIYKPVVYTSPVCSEHSCNEFTSIISTSLLGV